MTEATQPTGTTASKVRIEPPSKQTEIPLRVSALTKHQTTSGSPVANDDQSSKNKEQEAGAAKKTMAELDDELRLKLEGRSGEGGEAGLELEDGRPAAMKRGVKNNMFRLI